MIYKKAVMLSVISCVCLNAESINLGNVDVEASIDTQVFKDIYAQDIKSADLADALAKESPSVSLVRRSGIANDIIVRGQKKDNISVTIDGMKLYGGCPNRMDPPISHVLTNNISKLEIIEGPFNVEDFGALSASVNIYTLAPASGFSGNFSVGLGSWGYKKLSLMTQGGNDKVKFYLGGSYETSNQYKDGAGEDFVAQINREIKKGVAPAYAQYQDRYKDLDSYKKNTLMAKLFWNISENSELRLSYIRNRSDDILYPSSKMDAISDDSDLYSLEYIAKSLGKYSKELKVKVYKTKVDHPMSTKYRKMALMMGEMTHALESSVVGAKVTNEFDINNHNIKVGLDYSLRNWDGKYYKNSKPLPEKFFHSIYDVDTKNYALFLKDKININSNLSLDVGLRYDHTKITSKNSSQQDNTYNDISGYLFATYALDKTTKIFAGVGKSIRVPDPKELYWVSSPKKLPDGTMKAISIGTPNLKETKNYEVDLGIEKSLGNFTIKAKAFYSKLDDFIAYNASKMTYKYENVDAKIYGFNLSGTYFATNSLYFDFGLSYQRGKKDHPLQGQRGTNMPEIPPLKYNLALNYDFDDTLNFKAELVGAARWSKYDKENGEQELPGWAVINLKATKKLGKNFELTVGVDNLFDKDYAISNTYKDLILLTTGGKNNVMLMHEPGRNIYANIKYKF